MATVNPVNQNEIINEKPKNKFPIIPVAIVLFFVILLLGGIWVIINLTSPKGKTTSTKTLNNYPLIQSTNIPVGYGFSGYFFISPNIKEADDFHFMTQLSNQDKKSVIMRDEKIMESLGPYDAIEFFSFDPLGKNFIYVTTDYENEDQVFINGEKIVFYKKTSSIIQTGIQTNRILGNEPKFSSDGKLLAYQVKGVDENGDFLLRIVTLDVENKKVLDEKTAREILFMNFTPANELAYVSGDSDNDYAIHVGDKTFEFPYGTPKLALKLYFSKDGKKISYLMGSKDKMIYAPPSIPGLFKDFNSYIVTIDLEGGEQKKNSAAYDYIFGSHIDYTDDNELVYLVGKANSLIVVAKDREIYSYPLNNNEDIYDFTPSPDGKKFALTLSQRNDKKPDEERGFILVDNKKIPDAWDIIFNYDGSRNVYQFLKEVKGNNRAFLKFGKVEMGPFDDPYRQTLSTNGKFLAIGESSANLQKEYVFLVSEDGKVWMSDPFDDISDLKFNSTDTFFYFSGINNNTIYKVVFPLNGFDQSANIVTAKEASDFLRNIYVTELPERERKMRDSQRISDITDLGFAIEGLENGSILEPNVGIPLQGCAKSYSLVSDCSGPDIGQSFFTEYSDPSGVTAPCTSQSNGPCAYSISSKDGMSGPKIGDYQICFFLEGDAVGLKAGLNRYANGLRTMGCE